jgi:hypothetical protein
MNLGLLLVPYCDLGQLLGLPIDLAFEASEGIAANYWNI